MDPLYISLIVVGAMFLLLVIFAVAFAVWLYFQNRDTEKRAGRKTAVKPAGHANQTARTRNNTTQRATPRAAVTEPASDRSSRVAPAPNDLSTDTSTTALQTPLESTSRNERRTD